jgi:transposase
MTQRPDPSRLSNAEKDALILAQWDRVERLTRQIEVLAARVAELEAKLGGPPKTSDNSSLPPSRDRKANRPERPKGARREASVGRAGGGRRLHPDPDRVVEALAECCPHCRAKVAPGEQTPAYVYDKIELPPVRPLVTRVVLKGCRCRACGGRVVAAAPAGLERGSPFGRSIVALAVYLRYTHAIGYERLAALFGHLFGLAISEGALANLLARAQPVFDGAAKRIRTRLRRARLVGSDETGARVAGRNHWEWVFQNEALSLHVIRPSRGRAVPAEVLGGHRPEVWVSDLYGAQRGHAATWQICLAHQLRDCDFAIAAGDAVFAPAVKQVLLDAIAIGRRRHGLKDSTRRSHRADIERRMDRAMARQPTTKDGIRLRQRYGQFRDHLFTFLTDPSVPATNNGSEQDLRPSVVYRKVTNGFRAPWGADLFASIRSVIDTGRRHALSPFAAIQRTLAGQSLFCVQSAG